MANIQVNKTVYNVTVDAGTNQVTVTSTPSVVEISTNYAPVTSVNGKDGAVILTTTDIAEGTNLYFTNERVTTQVGQIGINALNDVNTVTNSPNIGEALIWSTVSGVPTWKPGNPQFAFTAGSWETETTINLAGDVTGSVGIQGDEASVTINTTIAPNSVALGTDTTGNYVASLVAGSGITITNNSGEGSTPTIAMGEVALGTNTSGNYVASLVAGTGVTITNNSGESTTPTIAIGQAVGTTSNVQFNNVTVAGDLTVNGTTTTINSTVTTVDDPIITLGGDTAPTSDDGKSRGVEFRYYDSDSSLAKKGYFGFYKRGDYSGQTGRFVAASDIGNNSELITVNTLADGEFASLYLSGSIVASQAGQGDIGSALHPFATIYANTFTGGVSQVSVSDAANNNTTHYLTLTSGATGNQALKSDAGLTYNPNNNTLTASTFSGAVSTNAITHTGTNGSGNIGQADNKFGTVYANSFSGDVTGNVTGTLTGNASAIDVTATNTTNATYYPTFTSGQALNQTLRNDTGLSYNPSTNTLTATTFAGKANTAGTADTATNSTYATLVDSSTRTGTHYINFTGAYNGNESIRTDQQLTYDPSANGMTLGSISNGQLTTGRLKTSYIELYEPYAPIVQKITLSAPDSLAADLTLKLPGTAGTSGQALVTDGSGNLSWANLNPFDQTLNTGDSVAFASVDTSYIHHDGVIQVVTDHEQDIDLYTNGWNGNGVEVWLRHDDGVIINTDNGAQSWKFTKDGVFGRDYTGGVDSLKLEGDNIVLQTRDISTASKTLTIGSQGYNFDLNDTGDASARMSIVNVGTFTKTLYSMLLVGSSTADSNIIDGAFLLDNQGILGDGDVLNWADYNMVGYPIFDAEDGAGFQYGTVFPPGTVITNVAIDSEDPTMATLTVSNNALATVAFYFDPYYCVLSHAAHSSDWSTAVLVDGFNGSGYTANTITRTTNTSGVPSPTLVTLAAGYVDAQSTITDNFTWTTTNTEIDAGARRVIDLAPTNKINEHVRVPFSLGVGPGAVSTNRGLPSDKSDTIGINLLNNGKIEGYTGKTIFNLTQYKNNSVFSIAGSSIPAERAGGQFTFNTFAGDVDTANNALYLTNGDGMGAITWFAQPATSSLASSTFTPASISVKATETHNTSIKQGAGMYLQYTPNSNGAAAAPRTFVRAEDATTEVLAKTTLKLGKISTAANDTAKGLSATAAATWATFDDTGLTLPSTAAISYNRTYGEFCYTNATGFGFAAQNTIYLIPIDTTNYSNNTSTSNTSRINITKLGKYKIIMNMQAVMQTNTVGTFRFWLRKNGADVANSATEVDLLKDQKSVISMDWMVDCTATTDYWEVAYATSSTNYANIKFPTIAAQSSPYVCPLAPAVIFNVFPIGA